MKTTINDAEVISQLKETGRASYRITDNSEEQLNIAWDGTRFALVHIVKYILPHPLDSRIEEVRKILDHLKYEISHSTPTNMDEFAQRICQLFEMNTKITIMNTNESSQIESFINTVNSLICLGKK